MECVLLLVTIQLVYRCWKNCCIVMRKTTFIVIWTSCCQIELRECPTLAIRQNRPCICLFQIYTEYIFLIFCTYCTFLPKTESTISFLAFFLGGINSRLVNGYSACVLLKCWSPTRLSMWIFKTCETYRLVSVYRWSAAAQSASCSWRPLVTRARFPQSSTHLAPNLPIRGKYDVAFLRGKSPDDNCPACEEGKC